MPEATTLETAAAIPWQVKLRFKRSIKLAFEGQRVLILAGAGGVGLYSSNPLAAKPMFTAYGWQILIMATRSRSTELLFLASRGS